MPAIREITRSEGLRPLPLAAYTMTIEYIVMYSTVRVYGIMTL